MHSELLKGRLQQTVGVLAGDIDLVLIGTLREIFARAKLADREEFKASLVNAYHCARYYAPELKRYAIFISTPKEVVIVGGSAGATYAVGMYVLVRNLPTRQGLR